MKAIRTLAPASLALAALLAGGAARSASAQTAGDFGSPPSGEIPIIFNDHHVYATPDTQKANRVLAAIVRKGTLLVPLRSMFEAMGATVTYDSGTKTVDVAKQGSDVKVTVGQPEVVINGESRPLDVPPEIYKGAVVVPVRVISEGMGAYVLWVPEKRLVVVRYVPAPVATPPPPTPSPAPTATPPPPPPLPSAPPTPVPVKTASPYEKFVNVDYLISPKIYNEFSPGNTGSNGYRIDGAFEFPLVGLPWMVGADYRGFSFPHNAGPFAYCPDPGNQGCVTVIGGGTQTYVPSFSGRISDLDGHFGIKIADPRVYLAAGYEVESSTYGYPTQRSLGIGLDKLPDLEKPLSFYGSFYYYPSTQGTFTAPNGTQYKVEYRLMKYAVGAELTLGKTPFALDLGWLGAGAGNKQYAPTGETYSSPYAGIGLHF